MMIKDSNIIPFHTFSLRYLSKKCDIHENAQYPDPNRNRVGCARWIADLKVIRLYVYPSQRKRFYEVDVERESLSQWLSHLDRKTWATPQVLTCLWRCWVRFAMPHENKAVDDTAISKSPRNLVTSSLRWKIFRRDGYRCRVCKHNDYPLEVDHRIPVSRGGSSRETNLWTLCERCNRGKSDSFY